MRADEGAIRADGVVDHGLRVHGGLSGGVWWRGLRHTAGARDAGERG